mmetsp:Transcript_7702/g.47665  ORF Transcript_7702/g.47665 Transcript_7702/m.47665 type:complete len:86 (-) Transcript_7702:3208-3465(-)
MVSFAYKDCASARNVKHRMIAEAIAPYVAMMTNVLPVLQVKYQLFRGTVSLTYRILSAQLVGPAYSLFLLDHLVGFRSSQELLRQ